MTLGNWHSWGKLGSEWARCTELELLWPSSHIQDMERLRQSARLKPIQLGAYTAVTAQKGRAAAAESVGVHHALVRRHRPRHQSTVDVGVMVVDCHDK
jgi:hypothetical protein